ncbi:MAG: DUF1080 domain-containing protein [Reichenbachiella sp.]|uniref:3-keto-disaccharide hydrolase n=1 Tax=Reichenbachiella sp. TaxID=2184521 RepID=UPI0032659DEB
MKRLRLFFVFLLISSATVGQVKPEDTEVWEPEPPVVASAEKGLPPSDAIILFDGSSLDAWQEIGSKNKIQWELYDGTMRVVPNTGSIETRQAFGDIQLHLEWKAPIGTEEYKGQNKSNSGVFLQSRYEVQILDSYQNRTYSNGQAGAVYKQHAPLVNAMKKPGEWQAYDIVFKAPRFDDNGSKVSSGYLTVFHNGILIQNHVEILGTTEYLGQPKNEAHGKAPIRLQDHESPISFRNIWVREL